jgi:hypothetical protein
MQAYISAQQPTETSRTKARSWVFTINNPEDTTKERMTRAPEEYSEITELHIGIERGTKAGTEHLQGFLRTKNPTTRKHVSKILGSKAWTEPRAKGSSDSQAIQYALKDKNILISWPNKIEEVTRIAYTKERTRQQEEVYQFIQKCKESTSTEQLLDEFPVVTLRNLHYATTEVAKNQLKRLRIWGGKLPEKNIWLWGAPGLGKTRWAHQHRGTNAVFTKSLSKWWDGYHPDIHSIVLVDEFSPEIKGLTSLLKIWADRYPVTQQVKNGTIAICPGTYNLIVTSNYSIRQCFQTDESGAIARRFHEINLTAANKTTLQSCRLITDNIYDWTKLIEGTITEDEEHEDAITQIEETTEELHKEIDEIIYWGSHEDEYNQREEERIFSIDHSYE